jgi:hypothetical protein
MALMRLVTASSSPRTQMVQFQLPEIQTGWRLSSKRKQIRARRDCSKSINEQTGEKQSLEDEGGSKAVDEVNSLATKLKH